MIFQHFAAVWLRSTAIHKLYCTKYQQDWNDVLIEGTIMLITLPENKNTGKDNFHCTQLKERKREEECCVEQPAIPVLKRGR